MIEPAEPRVPWDEQTLDGALVAMGVWTLSCNATVMLGGTLRQLLWAAPLTMVAAVLWHFWAVRGDSVTSAVAANVPRRNGDVFTGPRRRWLTLLALAVAVGAVYLVRTQPTFHGTWWLLVAYLCVATFIAFPRSREEEPVLSTCACAGWMQWTLACLAAVCAVAALVAHRPDIDDCFYLNLAVAAADAPGQPLLAHDTLHGQSDLPLCLPIYRLHSLEVLIGLASHLTRFPVINIAHGLVPAIGAVLCCFAWARLLRLLAPRDWLWVLAIVVAIYLFAGGPHRWYGNFALLRLHQGKALLVSVCVPALIAYGLQFAAHPAWRNWCLLSLAQVAALGISSTAVWVAPTVVGLALVSGSSLGPGRWRTLIVGLGASWYPLLMGLLQRPQMAAAAASLAVFDPPGDPVAQAWSDVLGTGLLRDAALVALVLAPLVSPTAAAARVCGRFPLILLATLLNPYWAADITRHVTGNSAYWRAMWVLPLPLLLAIALAAPLTRGRYWGWRWRVAGSLVACAAFFTLAPPHFALSRLNGVELKTPSLKVDPPYAVAEAIVRATNSRSRVLAPEAVAAWIPTFHQHPYPLMARSIYLLSFQTTAPAEVQRRTALSLLMEGKGDWGGGARMLVESIEHDQLATICFTDAHPHSAELQRMVADQGFRAVFNNGQYEVWSKSRESSHLESKDQCFVGD